MPSEGFSWADNGDGQKNLCSTFQRSIGVMNRRGASLLECSRRPLERSRLNDLVKGIGRYRVSYKTFINAPNQLEVIMPMKVRKFDTMDPPLDEMPTLKVAPYKEFRVKPQSTILARPKERYRFTAAERLPPVGQWGTIPLPNSPETYVIAVELPKATAEVVDIQTAEPYVGDTLFQDGEDDESIALKAWLEAYSGFCHDIRLHRIERKLVVGPDGREHIKRVHVNKVMACWLQPGDHFGDPDGRRHQAAGGYPTRDLYEKQSGQSQYMRSKVAPSYKDKVKSTSRLSVVTGEKQHYDGPHWTGNMSKQLGVVGFFHCSRPPTFTEVLSQHWSDIARFHQIKKITTQKDFALKSGDSQTVVRTWEVRDASCWGHTPLGTQEPNRQGTIRPPSNESLELLFSQQTDLETANDPVYAPPILEEVVSLEEYGTAMTDLEVKLEVGSERVSGYVNGVHTTLGFNSERTEYSFWLDDGTRYQWPPVAVESVVNPPPNLDDQVFLLPHLKPVHGFNLQLELSKKLLRETTEKRRIEELIRENEAIHAPRRWREVSNTLFETLVPSTYRFVELVYEGEKFPKGRSFPKSHKTRAGEPVVWRKTVRVEGHGAPSYRNLGMTWYSNVYPELSENLYDRWWNEISAEDEQSRLDLWFLERWWNAESLSVKERFTFVRDDNTVESYRLNGPRKPKQKVKINYVDRIETKVECEVVDLHIEPKQFAAEAVDLELIFSKKQEVVPLVINEADYGIDVMTGLFLPKHLNFSPKDFKERILPPDRKKLGVFGRLRGFVSGE